MGKLLCGMSAAQNRDFDRLHDKPYSSQVVCFRLTGTTKFEQFCETFSQRILERLDPTQPYNPTLQYPELRQYLTTFMGYAFLKKDKTFDLNNHFTYLKRPPNDPLTRRELSKLLESEIIAPYPKRRSPWHVTVIDNYLPTEKETECWTKNVEGYKKGDHIWVALLRIHHSLADGFAIQKMLSYLADEPYVPKFSIKTTAFQNFMLGLRTGLLGSYDALTRLIRWTDSLHTFHIPADKQSHEYFIVESDLISMKQVKAIKEKFGVAFTAILVAAISGGFRKFLVKHKRPIPSFITTGIPFTDPDHTSKFDNRFSVATIGLAVHVDDPQERVLYVKDQFNLILSTSWIKFLETAINALSCLPIRWLRFVSQRSVFSSIYSTQPGPDKCLPAIGGKLLEINFAFGTGSDSTGFGLSSVTYNKHFRFVMFMEKNLLEGDKEQAEELISYITDEFNVLEKYNSSKPEVEDEKVKRWKESIKND
ncbi:unnamed protein product [Orchesella dallaii]|uniref:O-acyltransferase WSD1 C-terminal domain-containing protein n=1 Tax=Orchesella dallaii TaxID=48710 RepID=A0ABP1QLX1_9HEXA